MYGNQTDLGDFYRGTLTLRQILARIQCLPPDSPLQILLDAKREEAEELRNIREHDEVLGLFNRKG